MIDHALGNRLQVAALILLAALALLLPLASFPGLRLSLLTLVAFAGALLARRNPHKPLPLLLPLLAWALLSSLSAFWSPAPEMTLKAVLYEELLPAGLFFAAWKVASQPTARERLLIALSAGVLLLAGFSSFIDWTLGLDALLSGDLRPGVLHAYPGVGVASTAAAFSLCLAPLLLAGLGSRERLWVAASCFGALVVGWQSANRAFWIDVALVIILWFFLALRARNRLPKRIIRRFGIASVVAFLTVAMVLTTNPMLPSEPNISRVDTATARIDRDTRLQAWPIWIKHIGERPWFGYGYGKRQIENSLTDVFRQQVLAIDPALASHAHNIFLNTLAQLGVFGLLLFIWLLAAFAHLFVVRRDYPLPVAAVAASGLSLLVLMIGKNLTDDFMGQAVLPYFWLLAGTLAGLLARAIVQYQLAPPGADCPLS